MQRVRHLIHAAVIGSVVVAFSTNPGASAPRREEHSRAAAAKAIDALDRCVQERFIRIDNGFGLSRISTAMHNTRHFVPTNDVESRAVGDFEALGLRVVMYVASRQRPRSGPNGAAIPPVIQGPVFVSPTPQVLTRNAGGAPMEVRADPQLLNDLPNDDDVRAQGLLLLSAPAAAESWQFAIGRWSFVARAVRASASACLKCHNYRPASVAAGRSVDGSVDEPFRLGDPLGAVLYGYQKGAGVR
jgi:hypothetical protein